MNDTSMVASDGLREGRGEVAGVRPLHRDDPRIPPERLRELAAAHVERVDAAGAALQEDVGEAAGRCADVEAYRPARVDPNASSAAASLWPPRLTYGSGRATSRASRVDQVARLAVAPGGVAVPDLDLARQHQRLGPRARGGEPTLDEQLVEALACGRDGLTAPIVAQAASPRLTGGPRGSPAIALRLRRASRRVRCWRSIDNSTRLAGLKGALGAHLQARNVRSRRSMLVDIRRATKPDLAATYAAPGRPYTSGGTILIGAKRRRRPPLALNAAD